MYIYIHTYMCMWYAYLYSLCSAQQFCSMYKYVNIQCINCVPQGLFTFLKHFLELLIRFAECPSMLWHSDTAATQKRTFTRRHTTSILAYSIHLLIFSLLLEKRSRTAQGLSPTQGIHLHAPLHLRANHHMAYAEDLVAGPCEDVQGNRERLPSQRTILLSTPTTPVCCSRLHPLYCSRLPLPSTAPLSGTRLLLSFCAASVWRGQSQGRVMACSRRQTGIGHVLCTLLKCGVNFAYGLCGVWLVKARTARHAYRVCVCVRACVCVCGFRHVYICVFV
jgi:hypothetical protein